MNNLTVFGSVLKDLDKFYVGFDQQFDRLTKMRDDLTKNIASYPFYNIKKIGDSKYQIQLALAGWSKSQIDIELAGDKLVIKGNVDNEPDDTKDYFFKGISQRAFTRTFLLNDHVVVHNAEFINGILSIMLEQIVPEHKKPRKISIDGDAGTTTSETKQLLTEA